MIGTENESDWQDWQDVESVTVKTTAGWRITLPSTKARIRMRCLFSDARLDSDSVLDVQQLRGIEIEMDGVAGKAADGVIVTVEKE